MFHVVFCIILLVIHMKRIIYLELIFLLSLTYYVVSGRRGFLFFLVLGMGCVILLWHSLGLPYNYFVVSVRWDFLSLLLVGQAVWLSPGLPYNYFRVDVLCRILYSLGRLCYLIMPLPEPYIHVY